MYLGNNYNVYPITIIALQSWFFIDEANPLINITFMPHITTHAPMYTCTCTAYTHVSTCVTTTHVTTHNYPRTSTCTCVVMLPHILHCMYSHMKIALITVFVIYNCTCKYFNSSYTCKTAKLPLDLPRSWPEWTTLAGMAPSSLPTPSSPSRPPGPAPCSVLLMTQPLHPVRGKGSRGWVSVSIDK